MPVTASQSSVFIKEYVFLFNCYAGCTAKMAAKLLRFVVTSPLKVGQQFNNKYGPLASTNSFCGMSSNLLSTKRLFSLSVPEMVTSHLTSICGQSKTWQRPQTDVTTAAKTMNNLTMDICSPTQEKFHALKASIYKCNPKCIRKFNELPVQHYSVLSTGKIMPNQSIVSTKRPPKASRTKQPSRANLPQLSETEVKYEAFVVVNSGQKDSLYRTVTKSLLDREKILIFEVSWCSFRNPG